MTSHAVGLAVETHLWSAGYPSLLRLSTLFPGRQGSTLGVACLLGLGYIANMGSSVGAHPRQSGCEWIGFVPKVLCQELGLYEAMRRQDLHICGGFRSARPL